MYICHIFKSYIYIYIYTQIFLGLWIKYVLSTITNLKIIIIRYLLELKKENNDACKASFLELSKKSTVGNLPLSCLIKEMSFYINCMPYLDNNIPFKTFYSLTGSKILRIARIRADLINIVKRVNLLLS